jgi:isochorismate synthase EntC
VEALAVARALHPTPAVAGTPTAAATAWIARLEEARRGWYAGAIGAYGEDRLTLGVALRGARLAGRGATLFVGAGIVPGSDAGAEWAETELKASVMLRALEEPDGA